MKKRTKCLVGVILSQAGCLAVGLWMEHQYVSSMVSHAFEETTRAELHGLADDIFDALGTQDPHALGVDAADCPEVRHTLSSLCPPGGGAMIVDHEWRMVVAAESGPPGPAARATGQRVHWTPSEATSDGSARWWGRIELEAEAHLAAVRPLEGAGGFLVVHQPLSHRAASLQTVLRSLPAASGMSFVWLCALLTIVAYLFLGRFFDEVDRDNKASAAENLRQRQNLERTRDAVIFGLAKLADSRDPETGDHLERISIYSTTLASALCRHPRYGPQVTPAFVRVIGISSALHDIGKVGIEDRILRKPGKLTPAEQTKMRKHTTIGGKCLRDLEQRLGSSNFLQMAREITFAHHERWDGTGYPNGLRREEIPLSARLVAIADVYDALSSRRIYKAALPHEECVEIIRTLAGTHFDPELVELWLSIESKFRDIAAQYTGDASSSTSPQPDDAGAQETMDQLKEALVATVVAGDR